MINSLAKHAKIKKEINKKELEVLEKLGNFENFIDIKFEETKFCFG